MHGERFSNVLGLSRVKSTGTPVPWTFCHLECGIQQEAQPLQSSVSSSVRWDDPDGKGRDLRILGDDAREASRRGSAST